MIYTLSLTFDISIKSQGVKIENLDPRLKEALGPLSWLWKRLFPKDPDGLTITSGHEGEKGDGVHKLTSLHYPDNSPSALGRAVDFRVFDVDKRVVYDSYVPIARITLGENFDVVWEGDHIHIEYDPKEPIVLIV